MPPKPVDKKRQLEKEKIAEDKTFGLKNKSKSKVVQKYIKAMTQNASGAPKGGKEQAAREAKEKKEEVIQQKALLNSLFNMSTDKKGRAYDPAAKKASKQAEEDALAAGKKLKEELQKEIIEGIANSIRLTNPKTGIRMSELGGHPIIHALKDKHAETFKTVQLLQFIKGHDKVFWVNDRESSNPMVRCQEDVDAEVAPDERSIEEIIEERRAALPPGGTPVTLASFNAWKAQREALGQAAIDEKIANIKKAGGKGLNVLSGRDLFTYDASLFVDDEDAAGAEEFDNRSSVDHESEDEKPAGQNDDDEEDEEEEEADEEEDGAGGAASSSGAVAGQVADGEPSNSEESKSFGFKPKPRGEAKEGDKVAINEQLFLEGGDLPDDLDDLDDLDDDEEEDRKG